MISKPRKKVTKRRNPKSELQLENLLGEKVNVYSKYAVVVGVLERNDDDFFS